MKIDIFTDGSCSGNPGPGGWGAKLIYEAPSHKKHEKFISGHEMMTTNNRMEILAVIRAIEALNKLGCEVIIYSDSTYVIDNFERIPKWKENGWKLSNGRTPSNLDLWTLLEKTINEKQALVTFQKVPAHSGVESNEECDTLAKLASQYYANQERLTIEFDKQAILRRKLVESGAII